MLEKQFRQPSTSEVLTERLEPLQGTSTKMQTEPHSLSSETGEEHVQLFVTQVHGEYNVKK